MGHFQIHQEYKFTRVEGSVFKRADCAPEAQVWLRDANFNLSVCLSPDEARVLAKRLTAAAIDADSEFFAISDKDE